MKRVLILLALLAAPAAAAPVPKAADNAAARVAVRNAADALGKLPPRTDHVEPWCAIATLCHKLGDTGGFEAAIQKATAAMTAHTGTIDRDRVALTLARLGEVDAVLKQVEAVSDKKDPNNPFATGRATPRNVLLQDAALAAATEGHASAAERLVTAIADEEARTAARDKVRQAERLEAAKAGDAEKVAVYLDGFKTADQKIDALVGHVNVLAEFQGASGAWTSTRDTPRQRALHAPGIVAAKLAAGDAVGAKAATQRAADLLAAADLTPALRFQTTTGVARAWVRVADLAAARKALAEMEQGKALSEQEVAAVLLVKADLAAAEAVAGHGDEVDALLANVGDGPPKAYLQLVIARAVAPKGRKKEAAELFEKALAQAKRRGGARATLVERALTVRHIAEAMAEAGDSDAAVAAVAGESRATANALWATIVRAQARAGKFDEARQTAADHAATATPSYSYTEQCREIARLQAKAGQGTKVREWLPKETMAETWPAFSLLGLAEGLYREAKK